MEQMEINRILNLPVDICSAVTMANGFFKKYPHRVEECKPSKIEVKLCPSVF